MKIKKYLKYILPPVILIVLGLGYYFLFMLPSREERLQADDVIEDALSFVDQMEFSKAVEKFREAEDLDPGNYKIYEGLGDIYIQKNRDSDAIEILQIGVNKSREDTYLNQLLGEIYLDSGDYSRALYFLENAIKDDKENENASYLLAVAKVGAGNYEDASEHLDISEDDADLYAKAKLLEAMLELDDINSAKDLIEDIDRTDLDEDVADQLDFYLDVIDQIDDTDKEYKTDVYVAVMVSRGALYSGFEDLVISMLSDYEEEYELYWELNLYLGHAYLLKGNYEEAVSYLEKANSLNPVDYKGTWLLARAYHGDDNDTNMVSYYDKTIFLSDDDDEFEVRKEYFDLLLAEEQFARAEEQLDEILDEEENDELKLVWASSLLERELYSNVQQMLNDIDEDDLSESLMGEYYYLQAGVSFGEAEYSTADDSINDAVEINDKIAKYRLLKGNILYENGEDEKAETELERAIDLDLTGDVSAEAMKTLDRI